MIEIFLSLGLVPLIMIIGFLPTWLATLYWLLIKFKKPNCESAKFSPVSVIASASYISAAVTFFMLLLYAMAHSGI